MIISSSFEINFLTMGFIKDCGNKLDARLNICSFFELLIGNKSEFDWLDIEISYSASNLDWFVLIDFRFRLLFFLKPSDNEIWLSVKFVWIFCITSRTCCFQWLDSWISSFRCLCRVLQIMIFLTYDHYSIVVYWSKISM